MKYPTPTRFSPKLLLLLPLIAYGASYLYLAFYHKKLNLFGTVVHEGGRYTLLEDMFYASHFLGHIPVHTVIALLFAGTFLCLWGDSVPKYTKGSVRKLALLLLLFLAASFFLSLAFFGWEDTSAYILQKKQGVEIYEKGGSWNLHLPSTATLFLFLPVYLTLFLWLFRGTVKPNAQGLLYIFLSFLLLLSLTFIVNGGRLDALYAVWKKPRYLAHSVRELATFPITYFPIPLYFFLKRERREDPQGTSKEIARFNYFILSITAALLAILFYQIYTPLKEGIGNLAQKPAFAKGGKLDIPYLLSFHYFEHLLDSIYFAMACLLFWSIFPSRRNVRARVQ
jgi:hypothetical protein